MFALQALAALSLAATVKSMPFNPADSSFFLGSDLLSTENSQDNFAPKDTFGSSDSNFLTALLQPTDPVPNIPLDLGQTPKQFETLQPNFNLFTNDPITLETELPIDFGSNVNLLAQGSDPNSNPSFIPIDFGTNANLLAQGGDPSNNPSFIPTGFGTDFTLTEPNIESPFLVATYWPYTCPSGGSLFCCPSQNDQTCIPSKPQTPSSLYLLYSSQLQQDS